MNSTTVKRPYRSPLRKAQADATRQRVLDAGLALFAEAGYPGTSVAAIARAAGVAPETIYASVGSKRGIINALLAQVDAERGPERYRQRIDERGGAPSVTLEVLAEGAARFWQRHGVLVGVLRNGVGDPEIGEAWVERQQARRELIRAAIDTWPRGSLRGGLGPDRAADIAWAVTSDEAYSLLVGLRGWSTQEFIDWAAQTMIRELLAEPS
ncbi:MAG: TetR/AcrR family transcriptional regulator [Chloroflexota bacterium]